MDFERLLPMKIPTIDINDTMLNNFQSMSMLLRSPVKPINDFAAIINKEVPTAFFIGKFANNTNAGMIRNPQPAPTRPVNTPTKAPSSRARI